MVGKLLLRIEPFRGESLFGYIHRVNELNSIPNINWVLSSLTDLPYSRVVRSSLLVKKLVEGLSELSGVDQKKLARLHWGLGENLDGDLFRTHPMNICPLCYKEQKFHKRIWELSVVKICQQHTTRLLERCPKCNRELGFNQESLLKCRCSFELASYDYSRVAGAFSTKIVHLLNFQRVLEERIIEDRANAIVAGSSLISQLKFSQIMNLVKILSKALQLRWGGEYEGVSAFKINEATEILADWPNNLYSLLDSSGKRKEGYSYWRVSRKMNLTSSEFRFLYKLRPFYRVVEEYLENHGFILHEHSCWSYRLADSLVSRGKCYRFPFTRWVEVIYLLLIDRRPPDYIFNPEEFEHFDHLELDLDVAE